MMNPIFGKDQISPLSKQILDTPQKLNMEPKNDGLEFQPFIFGGVSYPHPRYFWRLFSFSQGGMC